MTYVAYKNAFFHEMQFWPHCYTVVSYQALFRLSVYKSPAVYLSGAKNVCFCTIGDFGSPTITLIVGVCNCSIFCCTLLYIHSCIVIILMGKRELVALLNLSTWCLVMALPRGATGLSAVCDCGIS